MTLVDISPGGGGGGHIEKGSSLTILHGLILVVARLQQTNRVGTVHVHCRDIVGD